MANEGVIKVVYPVSGLATLTAKILKPDDTVRDGQSAVSLDDSGHVNLYTNAGAITIEVGDSIVPYVDGVNYGNGEIYRDAKEVMKWLEADEVIDKSNPAQYQTIRTKKQSGGGGAEIGRKDIKDINGDPVTNLTTVFSQSEEP